MIEQIKHIGKVYSTLQKLDDCPKLETENAPQAKLKLFPEYLAGAKNIKSGDELLVFTWLHLADRATLSCYPRDDYSRPLTGVFSTRSPDRPNPIGIHAVKVVFVSETGEIVVNHLEALDQTPIIDIKPVVGITGR